MKPKFFFAIISLLALIGLGTILMPFINFYPQRAPENENLFFKSEIIKFVAADDPAEEYHLWLKISFQDKNGQTVINPSGWLLIEGFGADKYNPAYRQDRSGNSRSNDSLLMTRVLQKETDFKEILKQISLTESSNPTLRLNSPAKEREQNFFPPQAYISDLKSPAGLFAFYNKDFFIHLKSGFKIQNQRNYLSLNATYLEQAPPFPEERAGQAGENDPARIMRKTQTLPVFEY